MNGLSALSFSIIVLRAAQNWSLQGPLLGTVSKQVLSLCRDRRAMEIGWLCGHLIAGYMQEQRAQTADEAAFSSASFLFSPSLPLLAYLLSISFVVFPVAISQQ